jgi:hypothetical protein
MQTISRDLRVAKLQQGIGFGAEALGNICHNGFKVSISMFNTNRVQLAKALTSNCDEALTANSEINVSKQGELLRIHEFSAAFLALLGAINCIPNGIESRRAVLMAIRAASTSSSTPIRLSTDRCASPRKSTAWPPLRNDGARSTTTGEKPKRLSQ